VDTGPTHVPAVPRIYEKMQGAVSGEIAGKPAVQRGLFEWAVRCGGRARRALRERRQPDPLTDVQYRLADRLVLAKVRRLFGPELQVALVGAAPIAPELLEFLDACGVLVLEGYGLTETCAASTLNSVGDRRRRGDPDPRSQVFRGYYRNPGATEKVLTADGWLRTGDLGALSPDGFLSITGRKKDLIITSSGKNIALVNIESELHESRYVTEAVVYGDDRPYLVAISSSIATSR
jgi:long-chain acyl-CoA synthetase